jgi:superfamily II DNA or RNA helicase
MHNSNERMSAGTSATTGEQEQPYPDAAFVASYAELRGLDASTLQALHGQLKALSTISPEKYGEAMNLMHGYIAAKQRIAPHPGGVEPGTPPPGAASRSRSSLRQVPPHRNMPETPHRLRLIHPGEGVGQRDGPQPAAIPGHKTERREYSVYPAPVMTMMRSWFRAREQRMVLPRETPQQRFQVDRVYPAMDRFLVNRIRAGGTDVKGLIETAPGSGKTRMLVEIAQDIGIGQPADDGTILTGLTLVHDTDNGHQFVNDAQRGFRQFAPEIEVGQWFGGKKQAGAMRVLTYQGLEAMSLGEFQQLKQSIHFAALDEAHLGTGEKTSARVRELIEGKLTVAFTATSEYSPDKGVAATLGIKKTIIRQSFMEAVNDNIANGGEIIVVSSGQQIEFKRSDNRIYETDVESLIDNEQRNAAILAVVQSEAETGGTGIFKCLPGGESRHARLLAEQASEIDIVMNPATGETRKIVARAVGSFQDNDTNRQIKEAFDAGKIDVVFFTKKWTTSLDSPSVGYVGSADLTTSPVENAQLTGRGMRPGDELTRYYQIVDKPLPKPGTPIRLFSFYDAFGITQPKQGTTFGKPQLHRKPYPRSFERRGSNKHYDDTESVLNQRHREREQRRQELLARVMPDAEPMSGAVLSRMFIVPNRFDKPPTGWQQFSTLPAVRNLPSSTAHRYLDDANLPRVHGQGDVLWVPPEAEAVIEARVKARKELEPLQRIHTYREMAAEFDVGWAFIATIVEAKLQLQPTWVQPRDASRPAKGVTGLHYQKIRSFITENYVFLNPETELTVRAIAGHLHRRPSYVNYHATKPKAIVTALDRYDRQTNQETIALSIDDAGKIERQIGVQVPDNVVMFDDFATEFGRDRTGAVDLLKESGHINDLEGGILKGGRDHALWLEQVTVDAFKAWYAARPD